jgi:regulator of protease activity HflC (stomatin/prohibitin superfamily)
LEILERKRHISHKSFITISYYITLHYIIHITAQQDAERAKYVVLGAQQEKLTIITKAKGEAESAELIGQAVKHNPGFMSLRRIDAARDIADIVAKSGNKVYLNADSLLLNLLGDADDKFEKSVQQKKRWWG